jgi:glycosyltransferase involved in cell wall biosynthesis
MSLIGRLKSIWSGHFDPAITLVGYPFRATGRAEVLRSTWRALQAAGITAAVYDLDNTTERREVADAKIEPLLVGDLASGGIRLFHCNGNEAGSARAAVEGRRRGSFASGYNIIEPAWELPKYPAQWSAELAAFDEVWATSGFIFDAISGTVPVPVFKLPNASQPRIETDLDRSHFGLQEDACIVMLAFDLWSFSSRKNPLAAIECFRAVLAQRPGAKLHLVVKTSHREHDPASSDALKSALASLGNRVTLIETILSDNETKNLIRCCDCLLSLHRSEGFGRLPAEAMFLGKPVIATGWSGNMEFMTPETSFPVAYTLVPVGPGEYPFGEGQVWADPDIAAATRILVHLIDNPQHRKAVGAQASAHMHKYFSNIAIGAHYRQRFHEIAISNAKAARIGRR